MMHFCRERNSPSALLHSAKHLCYSQQLLCQSNIQGCQLLHNRIAKNMLAQYLKLGAILTQSLSVGTEGSSPINEDSKSAS